MSTLQQLCDQYGLPVIELDNFQPQPDVVKLISLNLASKWQVLPLSKVGCVLTIVIADPLALPTIDALRFHTGLRIEIVVAPAENISAALQRFYGVDALIGSDNQTVVETESPERVHIRTQRLASALVQSALKSPHVRVSESDSRCWEVEVPTESSAELFKQAMHDLTEDK